MKVAAHYIAAFLLFTLD